MKLISWNVNGLRACLTHDFAASFAALDADIFSVQETKMQPGQADFAPEGYTEYTYSAEKKGYSGTACWCKTAPLAVTTGIGREEHDHEGRVLTLEYPGFYLVNCYTPNSQDGLKRLDYRMSAIAKAKPAAAKGTYFKSATIATTMGPGIRLNTLKYGV